MAGYITYWSKEHVKDLKKAKDTGPLSVIYGGPHTAMPSIAKVKTGDVIYPVTIQNGALYAMARMRVERIEPAFDYMLRETGRHYSALIPKDTAIEQRHQGRKDEQPATWFWMAEAKYAETREKLPPHITRIITLEEQEEKPHKLHQEPHMCCAERAASGTGSEIRPRPLPAECLPDLRFGPTKALQKPLRLNKNGGLTTTSLSGFVRRMSEETRAVFESLFAEEAPV